MGFATLKAPEFLQIPEGEAMLFRSGRTVGKIIGVLAAGKLPVLVSGGDDITSVRAQCSNREWLDKASGYTQDGGDTGMLANSYQRGLPVRWAAVVGSVIRSRAKLTTKSPLPVAYIQADYEQALKDLAVPAKDQGGQGGEVREEDNFENDAVYAATGGRKGEGASKRKSADLSPGSGLSDASFDASVDVFPKRSRFSFNAEAPAFAPAPSTVRSTMADLHRRLNDNKAEALQAELRLKKALGL
jgi:hypothetical protein